MQVAFFSLGDIDELFEPRTPYRDGTTHVIFEPMDFIAFSHEDFVFMLSGETRLVALKDSISVGSGTKFAPTARRNAG